MASIVNKRVIFNSIPEGYPEPGKSTVVDSSEKIDLENVALNGGILIKTLVLSIDPYMRGRMRHPEIKSYSPPFELGKTISGYGVGVVLRSEDKTIKAGDHIYTLETPHQEYFIKPNADGLTILHNEFNLPWSLYVGVLGMPGETAYAGWKAYAQSQEGDVAFVTAGAGPVGSLVIQLAKLDGLKVIGSAGSEDKIEFMKEVGADVVFNYKTENTNEVLAKEGPINIYWDNVAGPSLDAAIENAETFARIILCGAISAYNGEYPGVKNMYYAFGKSLTFYGFLILRMPPKYKEEFNRVMPGLVAKGQIKFREDLSRGLESVGDALLSVQKGTNKGKSVVIVADQ